MKPTTWHTLSTETALAELGASPDGLSAAEAAARLQTHGPNELRERGAKNPLRILWEQFSATMVLILIAAGLLSAFLGKWTEAVSILAIVILFGLLGFVQEYRAERAMAALKKLTVPSVRVRRAGQLRELPARDLAPGDVILLEAGNLIPADARLLESANLRVQEAALTGESEPVEKQTRALEQADLPLGDRRNMVYLGTQVTYGRGAALVTVTGMQTELGRIASLIQSVPSEMTPLQIRLDRVGKQLALAGGLVAALVSLIGVLRGETLADMLLTAISVAVAVVPEGLPAVVTFTLALGAQRMLKRNALIRKLPAVETLGSVTTICSDKTGTLTENRMTVTIIDVAGQRLDLNEDQWRGQPALTPAVRLALTVGALCNDAELRAEPEGGWQAVGDPTEGALLVAAARAGLDPAGWRARLPRLAEAPFDSERKRMTTIHPIPPDTELAGINAPYAACVKGALDGLLEVSRQVWHVDHFEPLTEAWRARLLAANEQLARNGLRVLGLALRPLAELPASTEPAELERDLALVGLAGLIDPPRAEVRAAVRTCQAAGIRPVMITGDHPLTALHIARDLGLAGPDDRACTGREIEAMDEAALEAIVERTPVFARVSPEHKLRLVAALQRRGQIVAMTGDGVNDAPALKKADIGVAMGLTGADVSKEAADMVLRDDNFATIVAAVEEGRVIYDNVRRFVKFSIAGNVGKVAVMLLAPLAGINVALLPLQLLWLNLLTDGLLGLGLGVEQAERNIMRRPPVSPRAGIFSDGLGGHVAWVGALIGALALGVGALYFHLGWPQWQTMIFTSLASLQIGQALAARSMRESTLRLGLGGNRLLWAMVALTIGLQLTAVYAPFLENFFKVTPLRPGDLALAAGLGGLMFGAIEIEKWLLRRKG